MGVGMEVEVEVVGGCSFSHPTLRIALITGSCLLFASLPVFLSMPDHVALPVVA